MALIKCVTVLKGTKFSLQYARMLHRMLEGNLTTLTDQTIPDVPTRPLRTALAGWWAKLELFAPWNAELRPFVFFDLDTYVLADISDIVSSAMIAGLAMLRDFNSSPGEDRLASGMMIVPRGDNDPLWLSALAAPDAFPCDGAYIASFHPDAVRLQDRFDGIVSYKKHCLDGPAGRIVCFHGVPKPHQATGWAKEVWDAYRDEDAMTIDTFFAPDVTQTLNVTTTSSSLNVNPNALRIRLYNQGNSVAFVRIGSGPQTATMNDYPLAAGGIEVLNKGYGIDTVAAITTGAANTLYITTGKP